MYGIQNIRNGVAGHFFTRSLMTLFYNYINKIFAHVISSGSNFKQHTQIKNLNKSTTNGYMAFT